MVIFCVVALIALMMEAANTSETSVTTHLLMMEAASTSETLVNLYQTTRCNNPEDSHLYTRRRENMKSHEN
jgi:hypothetical protein